MIIRSMNNAKEFPEGKTVQECLKALDAFPRGTLAAQSGGVVRELNDPLMQDCTLVPLTLENEEGRRVYERSLRFVMLLALRHLFPMKRSNTPWVTACSSGCRMSSCTARISSALRMRCAA